MNELLINLIIEWIARKNDSFLIKSVILLLLTHIHFALKLLNGLLQARVIRFWYDIQFYHEVYRFMSKWTKLLSRTFVRRSGLSCNVLFPKTFELIHFAWSKKLNKALLRIIHILWFFWANFEKCIFNYKKKTSWTKPLFEQLISHLCIILLAQYSASSYIEGIIEQITPKTSIFIM